MRWLLVTVLIDKLIVFIEVQGWAYRFLQLEYVHRRRDKYILLWLPTIVSCGEIHV